jgi:hypothetical protein
VTHKSDDPIVSRNQSSEILFGSGVTLPRAAEWFDTIPAREDVYEVVAETAETAVPDRAQAILTGELADERNCFSTSPTSLHD